jgi:hypothetical protein
MAVYPSSFQKVGKAGGKAAGNTDQEIRIGGL